MSTRSAPSRESLSASLLGVWRYPFTSNVLKLLVGLATLRAVVGWLSSFVSGVLFYGLVFMGAGLLWGSFIHLMRRSARAGGDEAPPDFSDLHYDVYLPARQGMLAQLSAWLPALLLVYLSATPYPVGTVEDVSGGTAVVAKAKSKRVDMSALPKDLQEVLEESGPFKARELEKRDFSTPWALELLMGAPRVQKLSMSTALAPVKARPLFWLAVLWGLLWMPLAFILMERGSALNAFNLPSGVQLILRLGRDYWHVVATFCALLALQQGLRSVGLVLFKLKVPLLSGWLAECVDLLVPFMMARALGLLLQLRGGVIGYDERQAPAEPQVELQQAEPQAVPSAPSRPRAVPSPATPEPVRQPSGAQQVSALEAAVQAKDVAQALQLYSALKVPPASITPEAHYFVGQSALQQGHYELAVRALEATADSAPASPLAPRALVFMGRVLEERMQQTARAQQVFGYILQRYPNTDAARFAQGRMVRSA